MPNLVRLTLIFLILVKLISPAIAQIDKARDKFFGDFTSYYKKMVSFAEKKQRDLAHKASEDMLDAFTSMYNLSSDTPKKLNDNKLRGLGSKAQEFVGAMSNFKKKAGTLQDKLSKVGGDYGSELSDVIKEYENMKNKINGLWLNFQETGKEVGNKYKAIKETCTSGCLP